MGVSVGDCWGSRAKLVTHLSYNMENHSEQVSYIKGHTAHNPREASEEEDT